MSRSVSIAHCRGAVHIYGLTYNVASTRGLPLDSNLVLVFAYYGRGWLARLTLQIHHHSFEHSVRLHPRMEAYTGNASYPPPPHAANINNNNASERLLPLNLILCSGLRNLNIKNNIIANGNGRQQLKNTFNCRSNSVIENVQAKLLHQVVHVDRI